MMTATDIAEDKILRMTRQFNASPEQVYDAWTKPELLAKWWGPEGTTCPETDIDLREGGKWRTVMAHADGRHHECSGQYRLLDRPRHLVLTWSWKQEDGRQGHETEIDIHLEPSGTGTLMTFVQKVFAETEHRDMHNQGWTSSFDCLEKIFT
ncbi:MAG: SRPBCC domain-containing protein [Stappiaceae bacterium]